MQYGITMPNFGDFFHPRALAELARQAEEAGWDGFFLWDHVHFGFFPTVDPWVALAAIALSTRRVRIGTLVTPLPRRRPIKLARETVSIDHLSEGRLILGVGIGALPWEWDHLGEEPDKKTRGKMLDEGLDVLTRIWSGEPVAHQGEHYTVHIHDLPFYDKPAHFLPAPVQSPRIPSWVGGCWPNRAPFRRAARWDGVAPIKWGGDLEGAMTPDDLREVMTYVMAHRTSDRPFDVVIGGHTSGKDREADAAKVRSFGEAGATWWVETVDPFAFGWSWQGPWPAEEMRERILAGPPRLEE
jgi:alkanesulfonate monooxygenase SsuD/methylene tetrahydromethanopterin reductase-like flavin-dependent oxidoreductase (luciferase family)